MWNYELETFIDETGKVFTDDIDKYTHIQDEWGNPYVNDVEKGQFVDVSAKKYLVSEKVLASMRIKTLKKVRKDAKVFSEMLIKTLLTPSTVVNENYFRFKLKSGFHFTDYGHKTFPSQLQFFSPNLSKYFNYIDYLISYLIRNKWIVKITYTLSGIERKKLIASFTAERNDKTLFWQRMMDSNLYSIPPIEIRGA